REQGRLGAGCAKPSIPQASAMITLARGFCNAIREAKYEAALTSSPLGRGARKGIKLVARMDAAGRVGGAFAETSARQPASIGFVDADHLVNAVHKPPRNGILEYARTFCRCALDDKHLARQRVN